MASGEYEVVVVGGAGHVGAPLSILLASRGIRTLICDLDESAIGTLKSGKFPFLEEGGEPMLAEALASGNLGFTTKIADIRDVPIVIVTIGTPVDEFHNPVLRVVTDCVDEMMPYLSDAQTLVLRSTVFPGVTEFLVGYLASHGKKTAVAFCPERVVQGRAIKELLTLPQIVSGTSPRAEEVGKRLFERISTSVIMLPPKEAEFAKLFCNAYRYIQFAAANQFYMMAESQGLDFGRLLTALKLDYPRMRDLTGAGLAAGPCLFKDTLQLVAFADNQFMMGSTAIQINEGLPAYILHRLSTTRDLAKDTVGLLGMAFKPDSDDTRASLSYKLKKLLRFRAKRVLTTDPFVRKDPELRPFKEVVSESDVLILCVPHTQYKGADFGGKPVVDVWSGRKIA